MAGVSIVEIRERGSRPYTVEVKGSLPVGRSGPGVVVADSEVSRQHVRLVSTPSSLSVTDLGSRNGTRVNGVALTGRTTLRVGDVIRIGTVEIIVRAATALTDDPDNAPTDDPRVTRIASDASMASTPPPPRPVATPTKLRTLTERVLGIDPSLQRELFPASTDISSRVPEQVWMVARLFTVAAYLALAVTMVLRPATGVFWFFHIIVPLWPGLFLVAPGLWRNVCPLAATNQIPRTLGFTRAAAVPDFIRKRGFLIASALFLGIAGARIAGLDRNGPLMATVLIGAATAALVGGLLFRGKSGWCSTICPLLPLQRAYGRTPFVAVPNAYCKPCLGCAKNCYDARTRSAWEADMSDDEPAWSSSRTLFVAVLPGFIVGFFTMSGQSAIPLYERYGLLFVFVLAGVGAYFAIEALTGISRSLLTSLYAAAALNIFYWFGAPLFAASLTTVTGLSFEWMVWPIRIGIGIVTAVWVIRSRVVQLQYAWENGTRQAPVLLEMPKRRTGAPRDVSPITVTFDSDGPTAAVEGASLLEVAESTGHPIESGCRIGMCGADPVSVDSGAGCLSEIGRDEFNTLARLGYGGSTRLACCSRVTGEGTVAVSTSPQPRSSTEAVTDYDRTISTVVIVGNGIAGITAADAVRRGHPECEIHVISREAHPHYNRMGISRLVYQQSSPRDLYLLPPDWSEQRSIVEWVNTEVTGIDVRGHRVSLGTGDTIPYDRLILATGARATASTVPGAQRAGVFSLRTMDDATAVRGYIQRHRCRTAVVAGGGLLGLEAAYALRLLGMDVAVLERGPRLLGKNIDDTCSGLVLSHFAAAGIRVMPNAELAQVMGDPETSAILLKDGRQVPCDVALIAIGITPDVEVARAAGVEVGRGILVDDRMRTSARDVFAAGDAVEHRGRVIGLWPAGAEQATVAAANALGAHRTLTVETPPVVLKGVGLGLFSLGRVRPEPGDEVIVYSDPAVPSHRRAVISGGRLVGITLLGSGTDPGPATDLIRHRSFLEADTLGRLRAGDWTAVGVPDRTQPVDLSRAPA